MKKHLNKIIISLFCFIIPILFTIGPIYARAGGGGGGSSGGRGGIFGLIFAIPVFIYGLIKVSIRNKKLKELKAKNDIVLDNIDDQDIIWNKDNIYNRIKEVYDNVQLAWTNQNIDILPLYLTPTLCQSWELTINAEHLLNKRNILEDIELLESSLVKVNDEIDDSKDWFIVCIKGKMIDYTINTTNNRKINGEKNKPQDFIEYWRFKRIDNQFYLDHVYQENQFNLNDYMKE